jgi:colanic acid biosynthesis glycosyl transferase WcaI
VSAPRDRPRLLVFNQYYWPGVEATGYLLGELCTALSAEFDVTVITGLLRGRAQESGRSAHGEVKVIRVRSTSFERSRIALRAVNYSTYLAESLRVGLTAQRPDVVLCMTDPPVIADVALLVARRFRVPLVVINQDVFPEVAVELQRLSPVVVGALRIAVGAYLKRADKIVAIGETMRQRLVEKGAPRERVTVIPNWVDASVLTPQPHDTAWSREHELHDKFVVMHSGNVGHAQNLDALVHAAAHLRDIDDLAIAIIGDGASRKELAALARRLDVESVRFLPYQARDVLPASLSAAHVHVVGLARGLSGYVVPSRLYGILAVGRPVIVAADDESETAQLVRRVDCGIVVPPGRPELLAAAIRRAHQGELDLDEMGRRGRTYAVEEADRNLAVARYAALLRGVIAA